MRKKVYIALTADALHHGHMKLIEKGRSLGDVIVGLITDKVVSEYKRMPYLNFEQRKKILKNFKGVTKVISQNEWDYSKNIKKIKPDYFVHGDDWRKGYTSKIRSNVIKVMKKYGGKVIELPYTKGISSTALLENVNSISITADIRRGMLRRLINSKRTFTILEAHSPLSALVEKIPKLKKGKILSFDGFWSSS